MDMKLWTKWALSRNTTLLSDEQPLSTTSRKLTVRNGFLAIQVCLVEEWPTIPVNHFPETLYLQHQLRKHGRADIKLFGNHSLHTGW